MLDVKEAVGKAFEYFATLYPGFSSVQLEEVELTEDADYWLITLSYPSPGLAEILGRGTGPKECTWFLLTT